MTVTAIKKKLCILCIQCIRIYSIGIKEEIMKIVLDRQTTEVYIGKNAKTVDNKYYWNATFTTDFEADGDVQQFIKLICKFLNDCSDKVKVGDKGTAVKIIADSRTGYFSFSIELIEMTALKMIEIE